MSLDLISMLHTARRLERGNKMKDLEKKERKSTCEERVGKSLFSAEGKRKTVTVALSAKR